MLHGSDPKINTIASLLSIEQANLVEILVEVQYDYIQRSASLQHSPSYASNKMLSFAKAC